MSENTQAAPAAKAPAARFGGKGLNIGIVVAAVVTVAGLALWGMQLSGGLVQTGMRNFDSWGLYITMFMFLVGLSAGGLIISSVPRAFGMRASAASRRSPCGRPSAARCWPWASW